jgi:hypothetical protein
MCDILRATGDDFGRAQQHHDQQLVWKPVILGLASEQILACSEQTGRALPHVLSARVCTCQAGTTVSASQHYTTPDNSTTYLLCLPRMNSSQPLAGIPAPAVGGQNE